MVEPKEGENRKEDSSRASGAEVSLREKARQEVARVYHAESRRIKGPSVR